MKLPHVESKDGAAVALNRLDILFFEVRIESGAHGSSIFGGRDGMLRGLLSRVVGIGGTSTTSGVGVCLASGTTAASCDVLICRSRCFVRLRRQQRIKQMIKTMRNAGRTVASMILTVLPFGMSKPSGLDWEVAEAVESGELGLNIVVDDAGLVEELEVCNGGVMLITNGFDSDKLPSVAVNVIVTGPAWICFGTLPCNVRLSGEKPSHVEALPNSVDICTCLSLSRFAAIVYAKYSPATVLASGSIPVNKAE